MFSRHRSAANPRKRALEDDDNLDQQHGEGSSLREILFDEKNKSLHQVNFDEAIRMATDNKINKNNSWNFALIDYFHDMNLLRSTDGSSINFQKAGATLDGCMKIYSSRIDSISTETGQLLTGLSASRLNTASTTGNDGNLEGNQAGVEGEDGEDIEEDGEEDEEGEGEPGDGSKKVKKKRQRNKNSSLVNFNVIRLKGFEKELNIDPLFKKILSDFDEGGAKSLLSNSLSLNSNGRMVFVETIKGHEENEFASDDKNKKKLAGIKEENEEEDLDLEKKLSNLFSPIASLEETDLQVCKPMVDLENVFDDPSKVKGFIEQMVQGDRDLENEDEESIVNSEIVDKDILAEKVPNDIDGGDHAGNDFGIDMDMNMDIDLDIGINPSDHNESSSMVTANDTNANNTDHDDDDDEEKDRYDISDESSNAVMKYFDDTNKYSWGGAQYWKVAAFKRNLEKSAINRNGNVNIDSNGATTDTNTVTKRKSGEPQMIDFLHIASHVDIYATDDDDILFKPAKVTMIPEDEREKERVSEFLLPEDLNWTSKRLAAPFLKPTLSIRIFNKLNEKTKRRGSNHKKSIGENVLDINADVDNSGVKHVVANEEFWAQNYRQNGGHNEVNFNSTEFFKDEMNDIDDNAMDMSFNDGGFDDFGDIGDVGGDIDPDSSMITSQQDSNSQSQSQSHKGTNKNSKRSLNYSKTAKKVDVKLLKDNLWKSVKDIEIESKTSHIETKLTDVVKKVVTKYKSKEKRELSTSFFFICMLHLANEHSLVIETTDDLSDLVIKGDI